ncbi:MAG: amidohydrolase family protein [Planctomycetota bacterium]
MQRTLLSLTCAALGLAGTLTAQGTDGASVLIRAGKLIVAPGEVLAGNDARILIRNGKVAGIGASIPAEAARRARQIEWADACVAPGLVAVHDLLDQGADLGESIDAFTPSLVTADAFDPFGEALAERPRTGVTALALAPTSDNTFGGLACVVKPGAGDMGGQVLPNTGYLKLALVRESLKNDRFPTSRMGAADLIRSAFGDARRPLGATGEGTRVVRGALEGAMPIAIHARTHAEMTTALDLAAEFDVTPILLEVQDIEDKMLERLRGSGVSLALAPLGYGSTDEQLEMPARLHAAGVRFSFLATRGTDLRRAAALAVGRGLDRAAALAAITQVPAEQIGAGERVGTLRVGRDADFVVLTGDPVDLSARLLQVWIGGEPVHAAATHGQEGQEAAR